MWKRVRIPLGSPSASTTWRIRRDLAELTGLSVHTISDIELAKGNPTLEVIGKLCDCLGLELVLQPRKVKAPANAV